MKRAAQALRRQDWAAVAIEFFMVVLGVLLAFQISEWASGRNEERIRKESVDRLLREAEQDVYVLEDLVKFQKEEVLARMLVAARNLGNPSPPAAVREDMIAGLIGSAQVPKPPVPDSVYQELIASGRLGEIGDVKMRDAVSDYASAMKYADQAVDYARMGLSQSLVSDAIQFKYDPSQSRHRRAEVDFRRLASDAPLHKQFLSRLSSQQFVVGNFEEALVASTNMCREVARVARRTCQPRETSSNLGDK